jgi:hypothetical protein
VTTWRRDPRVLWRRSGDRVLVLAAETEEFVVLEGTAALVWRELDRPIAEQHLIDAISGRFAEDPTTIGADVRPFLDRLQDQGLLVSTPTRPPDPA